MLKSDLLELLERIPPSDMTKVVIVLKGGQGLNVETVFRHEETYFIMRGRESGSNDENRAFFVPYDEITYVKIERVVMLHELEKMYNCTAPMAGQAKTEESASPTKPESTAAPITQTPLPQPLDPATIARNNLLERIRAAKSTVGHATRGK